MIQNDSEYEDKTIRSVTDEGKGYSFTNNDGWSFWVPKDSGIVPHVGDMARFYGQGIGRPVRGLLINGQTVFYRTPEEFREYQKQQSREYEDKKRRDYAVAKSRLDLDYDDLPREFQRRLDMFRTNNPEFRVQHEAYEMSVCKDAVRIAAVCKTPDAVVAFGKLDWEQQKLEVPNLSDGHSGNSFGCAVFLARCYLTDPKLVEVQHGALCPLVGCSDYGCVPVSADDSKQTKSTRPE